MRKGLTVILLLLLALVVVLATESGTPALPAVPSAAGGPTFEVRILKPRSARPLFGLLPDGLLGLPAKELWFDNLTIGATIGAASLHRLQLRAEGWELVIQTDSTGRIIAGTSLLFPSELGNGKVSLRCIPVEEPAGQFMTAEQTGTGRLNGAFQMQVSTCQNAASGKKVDWPQAPLKVSGSFLGLRDGLP